MQIFQASNHDDNSLMIFLHGWHACAAITLLLLEGECWVRQVKIVLEVEPSDSVTNNLTSEYLSFNIQFV